MVERINGLAEIHHKRPSEIVGIDLNWLAFDFDTAVLLIKNYIEEGRVSESEKQEFDPLQHILKMSRGEVNGR